MLIYTLLGAIISLFLLYKVGFPEELGSRYRNILFFAIVTMSWPFVIALVIDEAKNNS